MISLVPISSIKKDSAKAFFCSGNIFLTVKTLLLTSLLCSAQTFSLDTYPRIEKGQEFWPLLEEHCIGCHNLDDWKGKLEFETLSLEHVPEEAEIWEKVIRKMRGGLMPPPGESRPSIKDTEDFITWLEKFIDHQASVAESRPGEQGVDAKPHSVDSSLTLFRTRRLNRSEYSNAIRDLLSMNIDAASLLPQDTAIDGFDNMAEALFISPSYLDQSIVAARQIANEAIGKPDARSVTAQYSLVNQGNQQNHVEGLPLGTRGGIAVEHNFPADGQYELSIGNLARAMWVENQEFTHNLIALLDGKQFFELEIGGDKDLRGIDQQGGAAVDEINARLKNIPFYSAAGKHLIVITFVQRSFAESEGVLEPIRKGGQAKVIRLNRFDIQGPIKNNFQDAVKFGEKNYVLTAPRKSIFSCYPKAVQENKKCAQEILLDLSRKAFRGYQTDLDQDRLLRMYEQGEKVGGFEFGIRRGLTAVLADPKFIYHLEPSQNYESRSAELGSENNGNLNRNKGRSLVLANRLALFLWGSIPDEKLLTLAESGKLVDDEILAAEVKRMLADTKARYLSEKFAYQWLNLDGLDEIDPDPRNFAEVPNNIRELFKREIVLFVQNVFSEDKNIQTLLTAKYTYLNEGLARHYGINSIKGDRFRRFQLSDQNRWGLLGKGGVLMVSAYPNRTSPVLRGAYVLDHLIGTPPSPPPPNVEAFPESGEGQQVLSVRARLEKHREDSSCNSCHGIIDPLGFALENFDAVGRWREIDRFARTKIDSSGQLPDGRKLKNVSELRKALLNRPDQFVQTFTEKLFSYALSRPLDYKDMPRVRAIVDIAADEKNSLSSIVMGVVKSPQFQLMQK